MEDNTIRNYAKLMQELGLSGLEIEENGTVVRLERAAISEPVIQMQQPQPPVVEQNTGTYMDIHSPMVGMFYNAPAENAAPFVSVGDVVHKGDVLCIIEAMKLMNEITSDFDGIITEVCVGNGQIVDFGHVLFRMKKE